jgi:hypothetical protein
VPPSPQQESSLFLDEKTKKKKEKPQNSINSLCQVIELTNHLVSTYKLK